MMSARLGDDGEESGKVLRLEGTFAKHCPFSTLITSQILPLLNTCPAKLPMPKPPTKWETFAQTKGIFLERWLCEMLRTYKFVSCSKSECITLEKLRSHAIQKVV
ncbi:uncharacterized protein LOC126602211 isoform X2 [Malus sylvestris]|uniref:uncharacterized protein LOC126602211 isoform X2 n=1 Tax=Malus sylvestris TaxID=3752 RepID=UPI0021ABED9A|nr:uncharacterized protein LOC126602211 isoform X2 [Malus sylvestris]